MRNALWRDRRGATAITFGILAIPVLLGVGLSVDYANMSKDRALVQGIADRALLAAAMKTTGTDAEVTASVNAYIDAEKSTKAISGIDSVTVTFPAADRVRLMVAAHSRTTIMNMISDRLDFVVTTEAIRGLSGDLEVAIALDTTGSMGASGKLDAAKTAAKELVDKLAATDGANVRFALVPFAQYVKVGTFSITPGWLDVPNTTTETKNVCKKSSGTSCTTTSVNGTSDGVPITYNSESCTWLPGDCNDESVTTQWSGCVGSRNHPLNLEAGGDASSKIPGVLASCGRKLVALTADAAAIKAEITALSAGWETYIPAGLLWGFNMLTPGAPMSEAAAFDPDDLNIRPHKALVLMTDGENTKSASFPKHDGNNKSKANEFTADLCNNIKTKKIAVYTVAFQVTDPTTKILLESCATETANYYDAADSAALLDAFAKIAKSLKKVRLAR